LNTSGSARRLVSVVVPVYNEAAVLPELLERLQRVADQLSSRFDFEFVFVDDGSSDESPKVATRLAADEPRLVVAVLRRNYGQTAALQAGFGYASGAIVVSMDADLQHFPEEIPQFLDKIDEGFDVVCGWRHDRQEGIGRRWPSAAANWLLRAVTGVRVHDIGTTFRAYTADVVHELRLLGENHRFVPVFARTVGARLTEVKIQNIPRSKGASNYGLSRTFNVLLDIFFLAFYVHYLDRPIRLFGRIAVATFAAASVITVVLAEQYLVEGVAVVRERSGWFTLALVLYVSAVQFLLFGVLSELLVRMYFYPGRPQPYAVRNVVRHRHSLPAELRR
jgi:glycosyltransferase involved in cell wall biosynthesis